MVRRTAIPAVLAALALVASAACSSSGAEKGSAGANPTVATDPPRTNPTAASPTTTTNPYAVPAIIDAAYVNRVLASFDALLGDVLRIVQRTNTIPPEAYDRLKAVYVDPVFMQIKIDGYQRDIRERFRTYRPNPGNKISTVSRVLTARATCIFVEVTRDYSLVGTNPLIDTQWVGLRRNDSSRDPNGYNPTPWAMTYDGFPPDRSQPADPCAS